LTYVGVHILLTSTAVKAHNRPTLIYLKAIKRTALGDQQGIQRWQLPWEKKIYAQMTLKITK